MGTGTETRALEHQRVLSSENITNHNLSALHSAAWLKLEYENIPGTVDVVTITHRWNGRVGRLEVLPWRVWVTSPPVVTVRTTAVVPAVLPPEIKKVICVSQIVSVRDFLI